MANFDPRRDGCIGEYLVVRQLISSSQLEEALYRQNENTAGSSGLHLMPWSIA
ncbi:MAG: hypothetical protein PHG89_06005 [Gallionella sp.]|nr:hypothetical protein [Gallionella sp.]